METPQPRRRQPTPKLKFPLFGNSGNDDSVAGKNSEGDINPRHMMYLLGVMVFFMVGYEFYKSNKADKIPKSQSSIQKMEWKGKVKRKFMGYDRPDINMFELTDSSGTKRTIDISDDNSTFFQILMPRDSVYKAKESLKVRIKNYTKDTSIVLQFTQN